MRIILLNQHFYPEIAATSQLATDLAQDLEKANFEIVVVAGMPSYLETDCKKLAAQEVFQGIQIYRVFTTSWNRHTKLGRILNYLSFYACAFWKLIWLKRADVIISMSTPPYLTLLGVCLKWLKKTKVVFWLQDVYPDLAIAFGVISPHSWLSKLLRYLSALIYRQSDAIVAIGNSMVQHLHAQNIPTAKITQIDNWADPMDFILPQATGINPIREQLNLQDKFVILYSGNMGIVHDFKLVQAAIQHFQQDTQIAFLFIGDGKKKLELQNWHQEQQIPNLYFLPYQPRDQIKYSIQAGNIALITMDPKAVGLVVPSKFYGAIAAGRPILAIGPKNSDLSKLVEENDCGIAVDNEDLPGLLLAIERLRTSPDLCQRYSQNATAAFQQKFARGIATQKFAEFLGSILGH